MFYKVITTFSDNGFSPLSMKTIYHINNFKQVVKNLFILLEVPKDILDNIDKGDYDSGIKNSDLIEFGYSITDYAWSNVVEISFKNHPYHIKFSEQMKNPKTKCFKLYNTEWIFNYEPVNIDKYIQNVGLEINSILFDYYRYNKSNPLSMDKDFFNFIKQYFNNINFRKYVNDYLNIKENLKKIVS